MLCSPLLDIVWPLSQPSALWRTPTWGNLNSFKLLLSAYLQGERVQNRTLKTPQTCQIGINRTIWLILQLSIFLSICVTPCSLYF